MPSIEDWAVTCSRRIKAEIEMTRNPRNIDEARIAAIIATFAEPILKLLAESKTLLHHEAGCMAGWAQVGVVYKDKRCSCKVGKWNKRVDDATR